MNELFGGADTQVVAPTPPTPTTTTVVSQSRLLPEVELRDPFEAIDNTPVDVPADWPTALPVTTSDPLAALVEGDYYEVVGLSQTVPNEQHRRATTERAWLTAQLGSVSTGIAQWNAYEEYAFAASERPSRRTRHLADECYRRLAREFVPAVTTLKPAQASRELNALWRRLLTEELQEVRERFRATTRARVATDAVANIYIETVVDAFMRSQLDLIERSNFDERPLLWSTLEEYFAEYMTRAQLHLETPPERRIPESAEEQRMACYYASVIEQYARREFRDIWFDRWATVTQPTDGVKRRLYRYLDRVVRARIAGPYQAALYTPMTEDDARSAYRTVLENEIALLRAQSVGDGTWFVNTVNEYMRTGDARLYDTPRFAFHAPREIYAYIDLSAEARRRDIEAAHEPQDDDDPLLADRRRADRQQALNDLAERTANLEQVLKLTGRPRARVVDPHGPTDLENAGAGWSPYDLSYPLDVEATVRTIDQLRRTVAITAADFDTSAQQARAHDIRRALDQHYTMQLLERRRAELEYRLDRILKPTVEAPMFAVRDLEQRVPPLELRIDIRLSERLEQRILTMSQAALTQDELDAQTALHSSQFRVVWYHRSPPGIGLPGGGTERAVRVAITEIGEPNDRYVVSGDNETGGDTLSRLRRLLTTSGEYRVEVVRIGDAPDTKYRSKFSATVKVVAHCARDGAAFAPRYDGSSAEKDTCHWHQHPTSHDHCEMVEELATLVERGPAAHRALLASRAVGGTATWRNVAKLYAPYGVTVPPPLPPWGRSDGRSLRQLSMESRATTVERFTFERIYTAFTERVGALFRGTVAAAVASRGSPMPLLASNQALFREPYAFELIKRAPIVLADWLQAAKFPDGPQPTGRDFVPPVTSTTLVTGLTSDVVVSLERLNDAVAIVTRPYEQSEQRSLPLQLVLQILAAPAMQALMTERERSFFARVARDFELFGIGYRELRGRDLAWSPSEQSLNLRGMMPDWRARPELVACLDHELAEISIDNVRHELRAHEREYGLALRESMFIDQRSLSDYDAIMRRMQLDGSTVLLHYDTRPRATKRCLLIAEPCYNESTPQWVGTHAVLTDQPRPLEISFSDDDNTAFVSANGSQPLGKHVDFQGLRNIAHEVCTHYTTVLRGLLAVPGGAINIDDQRRLLKEKCFRIALIYNYFAFASPPLGEFRDAHTLIAELEQPGTRLRFQQPI